MDQLLRRLRVVCSMGNIQTAQGYTFGTRWALDPPPIPASISALAEDTDSNWISYQTPYHPASFRRVQSYLKFHVPYDLHEPSIRDQWVTPSDPSTMFTNETIAFVADLSLPILDNFYPDISTGGQAATVAAALEQKRERETGSYRTPDASSGSYEAPAMITSLATMIEIKKRLPPGGTRWLFVRAQAKQIKDGKMSMEVVVLDEGMELVALSSHLYHIIDLSRARADKQKL